MEHRAFTTKYSGIARILQTQVSLCIPFSDDDLREESDKIELKNYIAIWDTGATNSVITEKVANDLGLKPIRVVEIHHAAGKSLANVYLVNIGLPNGVMVRNVHVTEGKLINDNLPEERQSNVLIGMDIITKGDFCVTNFNQKTTLSFRIPSNKEIDLIPETQEHNILEGGNRHARRAFKHRH